MGSSEIVKLPAQMCLLLDLSKHLLQPPASHAKRIILTLLYLHIRVCSTDWGSGSLLAQEIMYNDIAKPMQLVHIPLAVRYNPSELTALKKKNVQSYKILFILLGKCIYLGVCMFYPLLQKIHGRFIMS